MVRAISRRTERNAQLFSDGFEVRERGMSGSPDQGAAGNCAMEYSEKYPPHPCDDFDIAIMIITPC
jgi:hypothetical protein